MNIGIDIDDTINDLAVVLNEYVKKYNKEQKIDYAIRDDIWEWDKACGWNEYHIENFLKTYIEEVYKKATIKENAKEIINKLKEEGHKIIIITSRSEEHCHNPYKVSEEWLKKKGIKYDKLVVNGYDKAEKCKENNVDILIDDHVEFLKEVNRNNIKVLMFNSPYNQKCNDYMRVYTWEEVYEKINSK